MPEGDIFPVPESPKRQGTGHYRTDDDIELPPIAAADSANAETFGSHKEGGRPSGLRTILGAAALVAVLTVGGWFAMRGGSVEEQHPNWQHVSAAASVSDANSSQLVHVDGSGSPQILPTIELSSQADVDRSATREIRTALRRNDLITATAALQSAQGMPSASQNPDVQPPQFAADSELASDIKEGRQELYQIELFDCCDEDGDIVELLVNGTSFAAVPIMHDGTMLSIPLQSGSNTVTIRGVKDGGGGVTLSFRTSRGEYFARAMRVGEQYQMEVVVR